MENIKRVFAKISIIFILWIILSTLEIGFHNTDKDYQYSKLNCFEILAKYQKTETKTVIDCQREMNYYIITVKDSKGNIYQFYDDEYYYYGSIIE